MDSYLRLRLSHKEATPTYVYLLTNKASTSYTERYQIHGDPDTYYGIISQHIADFRKCQHFNNVNHLFHSGVAHADEALYLFPVRNRMFQSSIPTESEERVRDAMVEMWVNFAKTGYEFKFSRLHSLLVC